jgi:hypothetical protein
MPVWTARCKSGYTFHGRPCQRACRRGALLCDDCLDAVVVPAPATPGRMLGAALYLVAGTLAAVAAGVMWLA